VKKNSSKDVLEKEAKTTVTFGAFFEFCASRVVTHGV
jgi:hypothetical protein